MRIFAAVLFLLAMIGLGEAETLVAGPYTIDVNPGFPGFTTTIQGPIDGQIANSPEFTSYNIILFGNINNSSYIFPLPTIIIFIDKFHTPPVDMDDTAIMEGTLKQSIDWQLSSGDYTSAAVYARRPFDGSGGMMGRSKEKNIFIAVCFKDSNTKITLKTYGLNQETFYSILNSLHVEKVTT